MGVGDYGIDEAVGDGDVVGGWEDISSVEDADVGDGEFGVVRGWRWFDVGWCRGFAVVFGGGWHGFDGLVVG